MSFADVKIGKNAPEEVNAIIENPVGGVPVKYEVDKDTNLVHVDRFLQTPMFYPGNYGYIPQTLSDDGDPADVLVVGSIPVVPGCVMPVRPIGVLIMEDDGGMDEKILATPTPKIMPYYADIAEYTDMPKIFIEQVEHFFTHYKDLEKGKWAKIIRWGDAAEAKKIIEEAIERLAANKAA